MQERTSALVPGSRSNTTTVGTAIRGTRCKNLPQDRLTVRECDVLQLLVEGKATKDVEHPPHQRQDRGDPHRSNIMEKLRIYDTPNFVRYAVRHGLIQA